jgi:hypothetical protein
MTGRRSLYILVQEKKENEDLWRSTCPGPSVPIKGAAVSSLGVASDINKQFAPMPHAQSAANC